MFDEDQVEGGARCPLCIGN